jgi:hypothetical protein
MERLLLGTKNLLIIFFIPYTTFLELWKFNSSIIFIFSIMLMNKADKVN